MTTKEYNICVDLYTDRVYRFILKSLRNEADAEDIVQNAFEILWKNITKVEPEKARAYLFSVAHKNMIDFMRKNSRISQMEEIPDYFSVSDGKSNADLTDALNQSLAKLTEVQRSVLLLRDYEGYSYEEIAQITELTEAQVKVYIYRARQKMQQYLAGLDKILN
ncbi:RNA polymerase sigma factor [Sphingobacteriales bacterium UPWRP_1]|nr:RNA polymerase subunit sigma-24 [Sphingobacteriales bacterium TSM_CSM]PSJ72723.1 RNA polymerase sigma factor [Sphingobacteriales bacterium UPWRP_1]